MFPLKTDSYKLTHWNQLPEGTQQVHSYFESRGGRFDEIVFFGLQYIIGKHLLDEIENMSFSDIYDSNMISLAHFGENYFNYDGWVSLYKRYIRKGILPIKIDAVPEGTVVPTKHVLFTIEDTDFEFPWLTNFLETILVQTWYPCTVATQSREIKKVIRKYREFTGGLEGLDFACHDFGFRGSTSEESAAIGGASHLVNFKGTDTLVALQLLRNYYTDIRGNRNQQYFSERTFGYSVAASEHSTMTVRGREHELDSCENMLDKYPKGIVSVVSDSYDIYNCCSEIWGTKLKEKVMSRQGKLVVRPDSGELPSTVLKVFSILEEKFGCTKNNQGYKVFPDQIGVIQGDGMEFLERDTFTEVLQALMDNGYSAANIVFGSGGGLLQKVNRDTCKFALKCSSVRINDKQYDVFKDPIGDKSKTSKRGKLALIKTENGFETVPAPNENNQLVTVYDNGLCDGLDFESIRERARL